MYTKYDRRRGDAETRTAGQISQTCQAEPDGPSVPHYNESALSMKRYYGGSWMASWHRAMMTRCIHLQMTVTVRINEPMHA